MRSRINFKDKNLIESGFTLVELLVVIVILGILAAVVVFAVGGITSKGKNSACQIEVRTVNTAIQAYYAQGTAFPASGTATALYATLNTAGFLTQSAPSATMLTYSPLYTTTVGPPATGVFTATCPAG